MPELPEVETVASVLRTRLLNQTIRRATVLWPRIVQEDADFNTKVSGRTIVSIGRRGKYLILNMDQGHLIIHLRMEGKFYISEPKSIPRKHTHVILHFDTFDLEYNDVRKFGRILYCEDPEPILSGKLGYEPFDPELTADKLKELAKHRIIPLKAYLLDQSVIAGIGNIYADEICYAAKISPFKPVRNLKLDDWERIIQEARRILRSAIDSGGSTIRSYTSSLGVTGLFQQTLNVYGRSGLACKVCGETLQRGIVTQRSTVYCLSCQKVSRHAHRHYGIHGKRKVRSGTHPA